MTIEAHHTLTCDSCGLDIDLEAKTFREAIEEMKQQDWRAVRHSEHDWSHHCPDCWKDLQYG